MTSLVHEPGTICKWCRVDEATTTVYSWPTCITCASGGEKARIRRYLQSMRPTREKRA